MKFTEYKQLDLPQIGKDMLETWSTEKTFEKSVEEREGAKPFVFYEGPPSANGLPGIHHVMARTLKDLFCRFQTQKGRQVKRKAGWDTHGLPVELSVEKELGITKVDIGTKISVEEYNQKCREAVMRYTDIWNDLTEKMGYWVDMENPYVTYESKYMESVWHILKSLHEKNLIYKGYTIQPYSPAAGTGLSSHELNLPGTYRNVKDTSAIAQFALTAEARGKFQASSGVQLHESAAFIAWTTTPWTLPSNTALAVGNKIDYLLIESYNRYTFKKIQVFIAKDLASKYFKPEHADLDFDAYEAGAKAIPFRELWSGKGSVLLGLNYEQLLPYVLPMDAPEKAFRVIAGDFVTTEDGTGIVHLAPTFGADDMRVAQQNGIPPMLVADAEGNPVPLVDLEGKFVEQMGEFAGRYVKNEYYAAGEAPDRSVDIDISIKLKEENKAFLVEKYEHSYPHCWRTDKPVLYYPLDSWFVKATAGRERMVELNKTINWKPASTGTGRFGNWLENLNDWNLSRSRYWGIPLPIWTSEEGTALKFIGSVEELKSECQKAVDAGVMDKNPLAHFEVGNMSDENYQGIDLHRHIVDEIRLVGENGEVLTRESDLIDVWFDSGSMPYAQWHYPFENKEAFEESFPADYIAEGVDQTRGWFYTLHAIASLTQDSVAYKNVVSNGLVLDKNGQKMSKRLGNAVDPFTTIETYGPDATRWYLMTNAQPWENLKFDLEGIVEVQRKFFRALHNTYAFFALYANVDGFKYSEESIDLKDRAEIDRWVISKLNSLIRNVDQALSEYEPTKAGRFIQDFVVNDLSNWYVRLCRKRFWRGDYGPDKIAAYQTLYECLFAVSKLAAPIAPFYSDRLYRDLNTVVETDQAISVHLALFPEVNKAHIDLDLEVRMDLAQRFSSMVLGLRKKQNIRVRQPLQKIMIPVLSSEMQTRLEQVEDLILNEINVKELQYLGEDSDVLVKQIKPNFKALGPKYGQYMKQIAAAISKLESSDILIFERTGNFTIEVDGKEFDLSLEEVEISSQDIPGWLVTNDAELTVALDIEISEELHGEGLARELVNRIQNLRKDKGFEVTDRIKIQVESGDFLLQSIERNLGYICAETLADSVDSADLNHTSKGLSVELEEGVEAQIEIEKV